MVVMTPYDCLGDSTTWLFCYDTVARYTVAFVKPKERNRENDGVQLSN